MLTSRCIAGENLPFPKETANPFYDNSGELDSSFFLGEKSPSINNKDLCLSLTHELYEYFRTFRTISLVQQWKVGNIDLGEYFFFLISFDIG